MKNTYIIIYLISLFFCFPLIAQDINNDGYHDGDVAVIRKVVSDNEGQSFGFGLNKRNWDKEDVKSWDNIEWSLASPKRIVNIYMYDDLPQILILEELTEIESVTAVGSGFPFNKSGGLDSINLNGCYKIKTLKCFNNNLKHLNISHLYNLKHLECQSNYISELDLSNCKELEFADCYNNQLPSISISGCSKLGSLDCSNNNLTSIDISGLGSLSDFNCSKNKIAVLDITDCKKLQNINCASNNIDNLNLDNVNCLQSISCNNNKLSNLDLSKHSELYFVDCANNAISSLDLMNLSKLLWLNCSRNKMSSITLTGCNSLHSFDCSNNNIQSLNFTIIPSLKKIHCHNNRMLFSQLNGINAIDSVKYSPQKKVFEINEKVVGQTIDYSSEENINGVYSHYRWFKDDQELYISTSKYEPKENGNYHCVISNSSFPDLILTTENTVITGEINTVTDINTNKINDITVYPNPAAFSTNIFCESSINSLEILSLSGKVLNQYSPKANSLNIDVSHLNNGVYIVRCKTNNELIIKRFVKN